MPNPFVHVELATNDLAKAREFYQNLFDWKLEDTPMADGDSYTLIGVGENDYGVGGGMMKAPMPGMPSNWMAYVSVDDVKAATEKAKSLGATVIRDITPVPEMGSFSIISDPTGAVLGLWQANR
ncbi:MAG: VOC family protein [Candidatus Eremiobacteraeota bacterium]|nr:VOC family protein [Candidatus Eremiobacteraeota bacterium]MBV9056625.1 VOC family protein [Candidatus Eremiobacteraeota bacterium]MBV9700029.1 VOC family protein [Candidatus Eremiobacteraeota bacterium]